jgi:chemotaxis protein MotB
MRNISRFVSGRRGALLVVAGAALSAFGLTGCIGQGEYDRVAEAYKSCEARTADLIRERDEARTALDQLRNGLGGGEKALAAVQAENAALRSQLDRAMQDYSGLQSKLANLTFGPLDAETTGRLEDLERQFPGLLSFDAERGMLRIASDLTFDSGSAVVKEQARQALTRFSEVLKSGAATQYEIIVEGHTDSQRIANPSTIKNHPTNRHLSVHRSIAVIDVIASMGVPQNRLMAAGWGEFRPAVQNAPGGNTPQNRRVEIYLARLAAAGAAAPMTPAATPSVPTGNNFDGTK